MKRKKQILSNIAPYNRLTVEEKLIEKGLEFHKISFAKFRGCMGVYCIENKDVWVNKIYCRNCERWLGGEGKYYFCLKIKKENNANNKI